MAREVTITPAKTYATEENVRRAVNQRLGATSCRYFIMPTVDGRFFPVFLGEQAAQEGIHFHFNILN